MSIVVSDPQKNSIICLASQPTKKSQNFHCHFAFDKSAKTNLLELNSLRKGHILNVLISQSIRLNSFKREVKKQGVFHVF